MASAIEWTNETPNAIRARNRETGGVGHFCIHASDGCRNCYAERDQAWRFNNPIRYAAQDQDKVEIYLDEDVLRKPLFWRKRRMIFPCSMTDLFGEWVPDEFIDKHLAVAAMAPQHTWQILTKRSERMREYMEKLTADGPADRLGWAAYELTRNDDAQCAVVNWINGFSRWREMPDDGNPLDGTVPRWPLPNVWMGVSIEDRKNGERRAWDLANTLAALRFWSAEPLLGPLGDLTGLCLHDMAADGTRCVSFVIAGGESGRKAIIRPTHPDWLRDLRDQCVAASVLFFFKQWGEWVPAAEYSDPVPMQYHRWVGNDGTILVPGEKTYRLMNREENRGDPRAFKLMLRVGKKKAGRTLDGRTWDEMPRLAA